jgi:hypothetical protein
VPLSDDVATVATTLDFDDPPLTGIVRITPAIDGLDLRYAADLNEDGGIDEVGSLGLGVALAYRFEEPGVHHIAVGVENTQGWQTLQRTVVVNDPAATRVALSRWFDEIHPEDFTGLASDADRSAVFLATNGFDSIQLLNLHSSTFQARWELTLDSARSDGPGNGTTALSLSPDGAVLYADIGDSLISLDIAAAAPIPGAIGPGDRGRFLATRADGSLYAGGEQGILRIDPTTGTILAQRDEFTDAGFALSADGRRIAALNSRFRCSFAILDADTLEELWEIDVETGRSECAGAAFSPSGLFVYVIYFTDSWHFAAFNAETSERVGQMTLANRDEGFGFSDVTSPTAVATNGRYVAFATSIGAFFVDTGTNLPIYRINGIDSGSPIGCCNVTATNDAFVFVTSNLAQRVRVLR